MKNNLFGFPPPPPGWPPPKRRPRRQPFSPAAALALVEFQASFLKVADKLRRERLRQLALARLN